SVWHGEIAKAIARARVAVLIVGPGFLGSKFIAENELPPLLKAAQKENVTILPLVVGHCAYEKSELEPFQAFNDPNKPLEALELREQTWTLKDFTTPRGATSTRR